MTSASTGAKAEKLPTAEETEQIKKEQESLPPLSWLINYDDAAPLALRFQDGFIMRDDSTQLFRVFVQRVHGSGNTSRASNFLRLASFISGRRSLEPDKEPRPS
jgi:hypothetical protein